MNRPALVIFDDGRAAFGPMTDLRPAFALRSGVLNQRVRIEMALDQMADGLWVSESLATVTREGESDAWVNVQADSACVLLVNGRWLANHQQVTVAIRALALGETLVNPDGELIAAHLDTDGVAQARAAGFTAASCGGTTRSIPADTLTRPWHVLDGLDQRIIRDLEMQALPRVNTLPHGVTRVGPHPVLIHDDATLSPHVHLDTTLGPIALDAHAAVHPFTAIEGPCYVGEDAVIAANTTLRAGCVIGRGCKIGGEVKASIVDDFSNKAHHGYLGNAIVGRWCNLGAGTTASNLKNTWGEVRMQLDADTPAEATGRTFLGPVLGDFVRTAIGTTLPTGATVGAGACLVASGFPPKHVPALTFLTDDGPQPTDLRALRRTLERMMQRRDQAPTDAMMQRLQELSEVSGR
ncbi:MAG: putative sugar nucleotidyl transferase [Planctomycetota bacterium]